MASPVDNVGNPQYNERGAERRDGAFHGRRVGLLGGNGGYRLVDGGAVARKRSAFSWDSIKEKFTPSEKTKRRMKNVALLVGLVLLTAFAAVGFATGNPLVHAFGILTVATTMCAAPSFFRRLIRDEEPALDF